VYLGGYLGGLMYSFWQILLNNVKKNRVHHFGAKPGVQPPYKKEV
jgi:hypothetical protein